MVSAGHAPALNAQAFRCGASSPSDWDRVMGGGVRTSTPASSGVSAGGSEAADFEQAGVTERRARPKVHVAIDTSTAARRENVIGEPYAPAGALPGLSCITRWV